MEIFVMQVKLHLESTLLEEWLPVAFSTLEKAKEVALSEFPDLEEKDYFTNVEYYGTFTNDEGIEVSYTIHKVLLN
jgi:hypothetical protein